MHPETLPQPHDRLHGLDAVRGIALLLGVLVHASMSWLPGAQHFWITHDSSSGAIAGLLFYVPHMFRMLLFFLLAGLFARMACARLGAKGFVRDRFHRIAVPLLAGWFPVLMAIVAVAAWNAWLVNNGHLPPAPKTPPLSPRNFPLTHLWFLYVLLLCYGAALAVRASLGRSASVRQFADAGTRLLSGPMGPALLAIPLGAALAMHAKWYAWFGIPTPDQSLYPNLAACVAFGTAFGFGWLLHRQAGLLQSWATRWPLHLALALLATTGCLLHIGLAPRLEIATREWTTVVYAIGYAFAGWSWTFAMVGLGLRFLSAHSRVRRYLADASYWIYLAHLPLLMAIQVAFSRLHWPWFVELPLALLLAMALLLASYDLLVRDSFLGTRLNGRRRPRGLERRDPLPEVG
jgi:peptidoglycan/LPS O-acetylase OafA/YrhL